MHDEFSSRFGIDGAVIKFPIQVPIGIGRRPLPADFGIGWQNRIPPFPIRPRSPFSNERRPIRIHEDIANELLKGESVAVGISQDPVVGLFLKLASVRRQQTIHPASHPGGRGELITVFAETAPYHVKVIRHQAIGRTKQAMKETRVDQNFTKTGMEPVIEPTGFALLHGVAPMNDREPLVMTPIETAKVIASFLTHGHGVCEILGIEASTIRDQRATRRGSGDASDAGVVGTFGRNGSPFRYGMAAMDA